MRSFEIISVLLSSGVFLGILALFYRFGRNQEPIDNSFKSVDNSFKAIHDKLSSIDNRLNNIEKDIQQLNIRVAVLESKVSDLTTNVSYLMWHSQSVAPKEVQEQ